MAAITSNKGTCEPVARNSVTANKISPERALTGPFDFCCAPGRPSFREILYPAQCGGSCLRRTPIVSVCVEWAWPVREGVRSRVFLAWPLTTDGDQRRRHEAADTVAGRGGGGGASTGAPRSRRHRGWPRWRRRSKPWILGFGGGGLRVGGRGRRRRRRRGCRWGA
jgi:hypothetical protein